MSEAADDLYGADLVLAPGAPGLLRAFNAAGVLGPADVHVARRLMAMAGEEDELVALAAALAVRAPRVGHVSVDLAGVRASAVVAAEDADLDGLPWPDPPGWLDRVRHSALVDPGPAPSDRPAPSGQSSAGTCRPLHLAGTHLYLDRYWRDEVAVAADLLARAAPDPRPGAAGTGAAGTGAAGEMAAERLTALFPGLATADQRAAAATAVGGRLTVIAGGPGTGKTTTVARILAVLTEAALSAGRRPPLTALAAPTGKAAARMAEAVRHEAAALPVTVEVRCHLDGVSGQTLHRLLGTRPDRSSRFRHDRGHQLPHDVVVVDEASMVSLALMARLLEAVRPDARLIVVGDPEQLVSVEAGAVLADIVGPGRPAGAGPEARSSGPGLGSRIAFLRTNHRFSGPLAELAAAVRSGDADRTVSVLSSGDPAVRWLPGDPGGGDALEQEIAGWAAGLVAAARAGDGPAALQVMGRHRVLCAHREGPAGAGAWNERIEEWVAGRLPGARPEGSWYAGRPVMVTANDYGLRLFNGDAGVVVAIPAAVAAVAADGGRGRDGRRLVALFGTGGDRPRPVSPYRLAAVETVFATTVHKSQGSEFDRVTLVLPPERSRLLTRELLYTAVTRARSEVLVVGAEAAVRRAVERPLARASGLAGRLWARA